ncbi:hypothetical protein GCM10010357_32900 [Streptomyces luteireticuli]|uniref:Uncharacterized protein n=1 Tax=Streptomyces luteireticuli TaxID=173858 RepID=A0ABN0YT99_9ACTN
MRAAAVRARVEVRWRAMAVTGSGLGRGTVRAPSSSPGGAAGVGSGYDTVPGDP